MPMAEMELFLPQCKPLVIYRDGRGRRLSAQSIYGSGGKKNRFFSFLCVSEVVVYKNRGAFFFSRRNQASEKNVSFGRQVDLILQNVRHILGPVVQLTSCLYKQQCSQTCFRNRIRHTQKKNGDSLRGSALINEMVVLHFFCNYVFSNSAES